MYVRRWTQPAGVAPSSGGGSGSGGGWNEKKESRKRSRTENDEEEEDEDNKTPPPPNGEEEWMWVDGDDELGKRQGGRRRRQQRKRRKYSHTDAPNENEEQWSTGEPQSSSPLSPRAVSLSSLPPEPRPTFQDHEEDQDEHCGGGEEVVPNALHSVICTGPPLRNDDGTAVPSPFTPAATAATTRTPQTSTVVETLGTPALVALTPTTLASPAESDEDTDIGGGTATKGWSTSPTFTGEETDSSQRRVIWTTTAIEAGVEEEKEPSTEKRPWFWRWWAQCLVSLSTLLLLCVGSALLAREDAQNLALEELQSRLDTSEEQRADLWQSQVDLQSAWSQRLADSRTKLRQEEWAHDETRAQVEQWQGKSEKAKREQTRVMAVLRQGMQRQEQVSLFWMSLWLAARDEVQELEHKESAFQDEVAALQRLVSDWRHAHDDSQEEWQRQWQLEQEQRALELSQCQTKVRQWQDQAATQSREVQETRLELQRQAETHVEQGRWQVQESQVALQRLEAKWQAQAQRLLDSSVHAVNAVSEAAAVEKLALVERLTNQCRRRLELYETSALAAVEAVAQVPFW